MDIQALLQGISYTGDGSIEVNGIVSDSRKVETGNLFVCIKGYETDGHKFAQIAAEKGAAAILAQDEIEADCPVIYTSDTRKAQAIACSAFYGNPSKKFKLVGITGTNGKTTTTFLLKQILESAGQKVGLIGTNQNMIGDMVLPTARTTPDSFELQALFAQMAEEQVDAVVMEVSSHALYLDRVYGLEFEVGLFTNLTQDHLDFHKTMENYADAKAILFHMCKTGIVNADDPWANRMLNGSCQYKTFSIDAASDYRAEQVELKQTGVSFDAAGEHFSLGIPGGFSVYNGLAAIAAANAMGISLTQICKTLASANGVKGRAEVVDLGLPFTVLLDYAHTPDGLENILNTAKGFAKGNVIVLFGCGGDRDSKKRPIMGEIGTRLADFAVITSDNPRTEQPSAIIEDILQGVKTDNYIVIENRKEAISYVLHHAQPNDVVILAGKGHEDYQIIGKEKHHFDETEILWEIRNSMLGAE